MKSPLSFSRILFVGPLGQGSTCLSRLDGLRSLGLEINTLDTTHWLPSGPRLLRSIVQRTYWHPSVVRMNLQFRALLAQARYDAVWIEKGEWIYPPTLTWVRRQGCAVIHYNTDDIFGCRQHFWLHRMGIKNYDLYLTTNRWNIDEIRSRYGIKAMRAGMGFDPVYCHPTDVTGIKALDVVFVGHWESHTEDCIMALREGGIDVHVWGYNWWKARNAELRNVNPLPYADYTATIARANMALCSLSHWNRNESTGRSFEIPAIGTMMLAEYTLEHEFIYGDGHGAVLFSNLSELAKKARYYLDNPAARKEIAKNGHMLSKEPGHSWIDHIRREWPIVERMLKKEIGDASDVDEDAPFWQGFRDGVMPPEAKRNMSTNG